MKTALVTGASRGIGRAIAIRLASAGFRVAVHYNANHLAAEDTLRQLPGDGHVLIAADLSDPTATAMLAQDALEALQGRVDVLVHNAGIYEPTPILGLRDFSAWQDTMRRQMQVNFWAGADLAYLLAPAMADAGWGRIIQIASRAGERGESRHSGYAASKAAQLNLIKSLAVELGKTGIGCFGIAPGWTDTEMASEALAERGDKIRSEIPLGRVASPQDVASLVGFLVTDAADYLSGNTIDVNGASYLR
ncbi:MAG: SDR family NAD(P)-dependent oxidoreductase [Janthinobacterium lividum]